MPEEEKKTGLVDKVEGMLHHHKKDEDRKSGQAPKADSKEHKESGKEKLEDYMAEDKRLEEEGKEYGGLM